MEWKYQASTGLKLKKIEKALGKSHHGFERELLRVNEEGVLSQKKHPLSLGSPLFHPMISLDFSEAQLELISDHYPSYGDAVKNLKEIHQFVSSNVDSDELLWPLSMPAKLPKDSDIPLGDFGLSLDGMKKTLYRRGLGYRYGRKMQTISGVHHNFSFPKEFWDQLYQSYGEGDKQSWISEQYMALVRNYLRHGWLASYLFGASPFADQSYFKKVPSWLKPWKKRSFYGEHATTLRMSRWGYYSKVQSQVMISYNSLNDYISGMRKALRKSHASFSKIDRLKTGPSPKQINDKILQLEAEYYGRIRPKPKSQAGIGMVDSLDLNGIDYIEVRSLDVNPFEPLGIGEDAICFHELFLLTCLFLKSPKISLKESSEICKNQSDVALYGRRKGLLLSRKGKKVSLADYAKELIGYMENLANLFPVAEQKKMKKYLKEFSLSIKDPSQTLSGKLIESVKKSKKEFIDWGLDLAESHRGKFKQVRNKSKWEAIAKESLEKNEKEEAYQDYFLKGYEELEISTQMILREAISQGIDIETIDREKHIFRLKKGRVKELIYKATMSSKDPLISYFLMENKEVTKRILKEKKINVPRGVAVREFSEGVSYYKENCGRSCVVKPAETNYGIGIAFIPPSKPDLFKKSLKQAFCHGESVLIEEEFIGEEYRFLVINGRCIAVCQRKGARVIGNGKQSIKELIEEKNKDPRNFKMRYPIVLNSSEKAQLKAQGLKIDSIPKKGVEVELRKNSNVTTGGDSIDVTDQVPPYYKKIAEQSAKSFGACFVGVDIMIKDLTATRSKDYVVIEANFNPALYLHRYPIEGKKRYVEKEVLKALGF